MYHPSYHLSCFLTCLPLQLCDALFDYRHTLMPLEIDLLDIKAERTFAKEKPYQKAWDSRSSSDRTINPISRSHPNVPYKRDLDAMLALLTHERNRGSPQLPIPSATWKGNMAVESTPHYAPMRHTAYRFRDLREWSREGGPFCAALLWEYCYASEYRPPILKGAGGAIRHKLLAVLRPFISGDMIVLKDGVEHLWFWDGFCFPPLSEDGPAVDQRARLAGAAVQQELFNEFLTFFKRFKSLKGGYLLTSRFRADEGPHIEEEVAQTWNSFAEVCLFPMPARLL